jgi:hypothetical protein
MQDLPPNRKEYTGGIGVEDTRCPYCGQMFPTQIEAYSPNTWHGNQSTGFKCPLNSHTYYYALYMKSKESEATE